MKTQPEAFRSSNDSPDVASIDRREWLATTAAMIGLGSIGCAPESKPQTTQFSTTTDVPLRVVWTGTTDEADVLRRTWQSISEQPLDIRLTASPQFAFADTSGKSDASKDPDTLVAMAAKADVVVYPLTMMAELVGEKRLMPLLTPDAPFDEEFDLFSPDPRDTIPAGLRVATSFAGQRRAVPLGGHLPALLLGESVETEIHSWEAYYDASKASDGKFAEPTSPGWAAAMYLWRLCSSLDATWLFDRETLRPLIDDPEYVAVMRQMADTVGLSAKQDARSPEQIYAAVASGELDGGIGFPQLTNAEGTGGGITFADLPSGTIRYAEQDDSLDDHADRRRTMMNPFMLVGSMAASCRQTTAADQFLKWLSGGQGSEPLYRNLDCFVDTKTSSVIGPSDANSGYRVWLKTQLTNPGVVPGLQLMSSPQYYRILDEAVRRCVHGDAPAATVCAEVVARWMELHRQNDLPSQQRSWQRAQGID